MFHGYYWLWQQRSLDHYYHDNEGCIALSFPAHTNTQRYKWKKTPGRVCVFITTDGLLVRWAYRGFGTMSHWNNGQYPIQKVLRPLHFLFFFLHFLCCSLVLKSFDFFFPLINLHLIPHNNKLKTGFDIFAILWKGKKNDISIHSLNLFLS